MNSLANLLIMLSHMLDPRVVARKNKESGH